jgi:hypothetical protein
MTFNDRIREHFRFLIDRYAFTPTDIVDNVVEYVGERCRVMVAVEQDGQVVVQLQSNEPQIIRRRGFTLYSALCFLDPSFRFAPSPVSAVPAEDTNGRVEAQLAEEARRLREYGEPFLRGDFSIWEEVERHGRAMVEPLLRRLRGEDAPHDPHGGL